MAHCGGRLELEATVEENQTAFAAFEARWAVTADQHAPAVAPQARVVYGGRPPGATPGRVLYWTTMPSHPRRYYAPTILVGAPLEESRLTHDWSERLLVGRDLDAFRKQWHLTTPEFYVAFGLANQQQAAELLRSSAVVRYELEMLARLYALNPGPAPWLPWKPPEAFAAIYEEALWGFNGCAEEFAYARGKFAIRFVAAFDRSPATSYRWLEHGDDDVRMPVAIFLRKLRDMEHRQQVLEDLARTVHAVRGGDFEMRAPAPSPGERAFARGRQLPVQRDQASTSSELPLGPLKPITL